MNTLLWITLSALATWRASRALSQEDGPFDAFSRLQERATAIKDKRWSWIGRGLACPLCVSTWVSLVIALMVGPLLPIAGKRRYMLLWGGLAGLSALIQRVVG